MGKSGVQITVPALPVQPKVTWVILMGGGEQGRGQELLFQQCNAQSDILTEFSNLFHISFYRTEWWNHMLPVSRRVFCDFFFFERDGAEGLDSGRVGVENCLHISMLKESPRISPIASIYFIGTGWTPVSNCTFRSEEPSRSGLKAQARPREKGSVARPRPFPVRFVNDFRATRGRKACPGSHLRHARGTRRRQAGEADICLTLVSQSLSRCKWIWAHKLRKISSKPS